MSGRRKNMFKIIGIVVAVAVVGLIVVKLYLSSKENEAIELAQEYLSQKYDQEMQYKSVRYSWVDPGLYHVTFYPVNYPDLFFEVKIWPKALDFPNGTTDYDGYVGDNYLSSFFCGKTGEKILPEVKTIWGENVSMQVTLNTNNVYPQRGEPDEQMTAEEMGQYFNYDFSITTNILLNSDSKAEEAKKIFMMIKAVQMGSYEPKEIRFWYLTGKDEKKEVLTDSKTWSKMYIEFNDWSNISSINQVASQINTQWFGE